MNQMKKTLSLGQVVLFGLAYMTPIIVLGTFGVLAVTTEGAVSGAYLAALIAMLFTAHSYGRMASAYPVAGSAYAYVRHAIDDRLGFIAGWAILLDYLFLPMVIWLIGAAYLHSAFPAVPTPLWLLAFIAVTTVINILGLRLASVVNSVMMLVQILVLVAFVGLSMHYVLGDPTQPFWSLTPFLGADSAATLPVLMAGAAVACYSFLGFDAVTTLTEETKDPQRTLPRAILLITLIGGLIFVVVSYFVQLAAPGHDFANPDAAAYEIARNIGGDIFVSIFLIGLVVGQFASGIAAQASGARLLYAMGRDDVLPKRWLGKLSRFGTPLGGLLLSGVVALLALTMDVLSAASFINFGAFLAFALVNLSVIFHYYLKERRRGGMETLWFLICPLIGLGAILWLMLSLDHLAIMLGGAWLAFGLAWLVWLTRGFSRPTPELHMDG
ncbi:MULTISPECIES: APC family permease [Chromohalobacter]|jgi:amino acid transporter|uniref:APC family permease n=1 Tax=Chromohalobacter TaxID=42054 RepID=UPI000D715831|nr:MULTISPECIES: APC family permease [Chromohalobacter]MDO0945435.1 APC family permease [Chromohalobacter salexigens]NQY45540.1 APC family permease [Chromohalobacter sp.]NWO55381.1 amino acid permease [Chromohalobacter salexigens]PWW42938.1 amino acid/polyamine/organocation transporter (APC superfamily) [Chromohalobacter salexigens]RXE46616.1 amino acid permease [Chromohalobacter salexigens]